MTDYVPIVKKKLPHCIVLMSICAILSASMVLIDSKRALSAQLEDMQQVQQQMQQQLQVQQGPGPGQGQGQTQQEVTSDAGTVLINWDRKRDNNDNDNQNEETNDRPKPIMYTFWEPVPGGCCGADEQGHEQLLSAWRNAWHNNGWDTQLLTMTDTMAHPAYQQMSEAFTNKTISEYDKRCFYRWLAMANLPNGGWMSDYDLFPLHLTADDSYDLIEENGNGKFTSYAYVAPALVYASAEEWDRVVKLLIDAIPPFDGFLSDMYVFKEMVEVTVRGDVGVVYPPDTFVNRDGFCVYQSDGTLDCDTLKKQKARAIHFSHFRTGEAHKLGVFPIKEGAAAQNRGLAADIFMKDFEEQCL